MLCIRSFPRIKIDETRSMKQDQWNKINETRSIEMGWIKPADTLCILLHTPFLALINRYAYQRVYIMPLVFDNLKLIYLRSMKWPCPNTWYGVSHIPSLDKLEATEYLILKMLSVGTEIPTEVSSPRSDCAILPILANL